MLPEVEKYLADFKAANRAFETWHTEIHHTCPESRYRNTPGDYYTYTSEYEAWQRAYYEEETKQREIQRARQLTAREEMVATTKDPVVKYLVEKLMDDYPGYVGEVLPILPATREELESLANSGEWCSEFDTLLEQATKAGVIPAYNPTYDVSDLVNWIANQIDRYPRSIRREVQGMVNKIVEQAIAVHDNEKESQVMTNEVIPTDVLST